MTQRFNSSRLVVARQRRQLSKKELADRLGVTPKMVLHYEAGEKLPSDQVVEKMINVLDFPARFFFAADVEVPTVENASFRSFSRMSSSQRDGALAAGGFAYAVSDWLEDHFTLPSAAVPDMSGVEPEAAAMMLRSKWSLGVLPVRNVVHVLESKGVRVFSLVEDSRNVNAFSVWRNGEKPFVFLNTVKSSESSRFDAAHELGHLVLHRHGTTKGKEAESEADNFASAFLMPRTEMLAYSHACRTVADVMRIKKRWNVSAMALIYRLHRVGVLTDWLYRSLCIELSKLRMRTCEQDSAPRESSLVLKKVFDAIKPAGSGLRSIADDLALPIQEVHKLVAGLTPAALGTVNPTAQLSAPRRGHLSVVSR
jgi:Zn-dependent peptidase ImmA (M78 family)/transcriptional regulator with XRE-family HTH domain